MYYCTDYALAIAFSVVTMFSWGSWANTQKLAGERWPYKLFYWDYVLGLLLFSVVWGLTVGSTGNPSWSFAANLRQAAWDQMGSAFLGGIVFNAANILMVVAIAMAGLSIAIPVTCGIALVCGTTVNYLMDPKGSPALIFSGITLLAAAIVVVAVSGKKREEAKRTGTSIDAAAGTGLAKGLVVMIASGILMSLFYSLMARTVDTDFGKAAPASGMLTPYTAFFVFVLGVFASTFALNPLTSKDGGYGRYLTGGGCLHLIGLLGGSIWSLGTAINLVAAAAAGAAIAFGLGQGATLVSALWGILVWREFKGAPRVCLRLNLLMFVLFVLGIVLIILAGR